MLTCYLMCNAAVKAVRGEEGSYLNQNMFLHCADATMCLIYSDRLI